MEVKSVFVDASPSNQAVIDLFDGQWSSTMPAEFDAVATPGHAALFSDARIEWAHQVLGSFEGKAVLELGPLEGAHTYMLERYGAASITSIEANTRAFLKCLCIKELAGLTRATFKLGSFMPFLENCSSYDVIVASGVLYHMTNPLDLLDLIMKRSDRFMLWTHYYDQNILGKEHNGVSFASPAPIEGTAYTGSKRIYPDDSLAWEGFSGGLEPYAIWLERESLLRYIQDGGFDVSINFEQPDHPNGPSLALCAIRR